MCRAGGARCRIAAAAGQRASMAKPGAGAVLDMLLVIEVEGEGDPARRGAAAVERVALGQSAVGANSAAAPRPYRAGASRRRSAAGRCRRARPRVRRPGPGFSSVPSGCAAAAAAICSASAIGIERRRIAEHLVRAGGAGAELLGGGGGGERGRPRARSGKDAHGPPLRRYAAKGKPRSIVTPDLIRGP